jgi:hypothetical protein
MVHRRYFQQYEKTLFYIKRFLETYLLKNDNPGSNLGKSSFIMNKKIFNFFCYKTWLFSYFILLFVPFIFLHNFQDPYTTIKWFSTLVCINLSIFIFLLHSKRLIFPKIPPLLFYLIFLIFSFNILNSYMHNVSLMGYENIRRFMFWGAVLYFYNRLKEKPEDFYKLEKAIFISSTVFVISALTQHLLSPKYPSDLTLGNINLSAEFVGFAVSFQFGYLATLWRKGQKSTPFNLLSALSISYLYITNCRSIFIAVFLMITFSLVFFRKNAFEIIKIIIFSTILIIFLTSLISYFYPNLELTLLLDKGISFRWLLYMDTLEMFFKNPLGVGLGQYEFASLPYLGNLFPQLNEYMLFRSPHDEFLYYLVEDGIIFSALLFAIFVFFFYFYWKNIKEVFYLQPVFSYYFIILFVQALFQFPLIEPLPYFMTTLMIGYFLASLNHETIMIPLKSELKTVLFSINLIFLLLIIIFFTSNYISYNYPKDKNLNELACTYGSRNWIACLNVSSIALKEKDYDTAENFARQTLLWQPLNFQGLKMLGYAYLYQGNRQKACVLFKKYDMFFQNQSTLHKFIHNVCYSSNRQP